MLFDRYVDEVVGTILAVVVIMGIFIIGVVVIIGVVIPGVIVIIIGVVVIIGAVVIIGIIVGAIVVDIGCMVFGAKLLLVVKAFVTADGLAVKGT